VFVQRDHAQPARHRPRGGAWSRGLQAGGLASFAWGFLRVSGLEATENVEITARRVRVQEFRRRSLIHGYTFLIVDPARHLLRPAPKAFARAWRLVPSSGFAVAERRKPSRLVLVGHHRFARYELVFEVDTAGGHTTLRARTFAEFPGVLGRLYRTAVIGSGGHAFVVRRLLVEPVPGALLGLPPEASQPLPDGQVSMRESVALAFITALQLLPAKQRAALLLVDVVGWTPKDVAGLLKTTVVSVNSLLQRARRTIDERREEQASVSAAEEEGLLRRYIATWESGDLDAFVALLAEDVVLSMPPHSEWYSGREAIRRFFSRLLSVAPRRYRLVPTSANGSPAVAFYMSTGGGPFEAAAIGVLSWRRGQVTRIVRFDLPRLFAPFGLPERLREEDQWRSLQ
jgi:RNA polymerase sigma-70 factor (TIGR02960 family)